MKDRICDCRNGELYDGDEIKIETIMRRGKMNNPVHKVKRRVTYDDGREPHWTDDTAVGWLATGVKDKNGVEIYEGHIIRRWIFKDEVKSVVAYACGVFDLIEANERYTRPLRDFYSDELEVIGHIAEGNHGQAD